MKLAYREFGQEQPGTPLILLHGLLGSLVNWQRIARHLGDRYRVVVPDLRNHGRSPHASDVRYEVMAADVLELMDDLGLHKPAVVGHSMGGKTAMVLALGHPGRVERLGVVDIAPVTYEGRLALLLDALLSLPLDKIDNRRHADELLAQRVMDKAVRDHMLQNLRRTEEGWRWRNNLRALREGLDIISAFPELPEGSTYTGKSLFIAGERSTYIESAHTASIRKLFPNAEMAQVAEAGHWIYAEQPEAFLRVLSHFLAD
ncbi:MAG TPA: alpha/beta fold hydrolase [Chromatiaceae bacterium]|nr:alpha/beta fold hydrolase [Chromatiaceae bacterium]